MNIKHNQRGVVSRSDLCGAHINILLDRALAIHSNLYNMLMCFRVNETTI